MICPTCGADVADDAARCPSCDAPVGPDRPGEPVTGASDGPGAGGSGPGDRPPPPPPSWQSPLEPGDRPSGADHPSGLSSELRNWGVAMHLGGLGAGALSAASLGFLAPLIIWLVKRDEHPSLDHHGKEALNFQLTVLITVIVAALLVVPAVIIGILTLGIGLVLMAVVALAALVLWIVLPIQAALAASRGEGHRYPLTLRLVR